MHSEGCKQAHVWAHWFRIKAGALKRPNTDGWAQANYTQPCDGMNELALMSGCCAKYLFLQGSFCFFN